MPQIGIEIKSPKVDVTRANSYNIVIFHTRPKVYGKLPDDQMEFMQTVAGTTIRVYLVRIGEFVE